MHFTFSYLFAKEKKYQFYVFIFYIFRFFERIAFIQDDQWY